MLHSCKKHLTCPSSFTMMLLLWRSPMPSIKVATQQPAQERVNRSIAASYLLKTNKRHFLTDSKTKLQDHFFFYLKGKNQLYYPCSMKWSSQTLQSKEEIQHTLKTEVLTVKIMEQQASQQDWLSSENRQQLSF